LNPFYLLWLYPAITGFVGLLFFLFRKATFGWVCWIFGIALTPFLQTYGRILMIEGGTPTLASMVFVATLEILVAGYVISYPFFPIPPFWMRRWVFLPLHSAIASVIVTDFVYWLFRIGDLVFGLFPPFWFFFIVSAWVFVEGIYRSRRLVVSLQPLPLPGIKERVRIAFLSDLHVGKVAGREEILRCIERVEEAKPDLIFLGGDFLTELVFRSLWEHALSPLARLPELAPTFAVFGNHDRHDAQALRETLERWGIVLVEGKVITFTRGKNTLKIGGVPFFFQPSRARQIMRELSLSDGPFICLLHDPFHWDPELLPPSSLTLSGHLHGGQIGIHTSRFHLSVLSLFRIRDAGLYERSGRYLYITPGAGFYGFPVRLGIPNTVSILELLPPTSSFTQ
jgi:predicted MPP superfamily phosphohydrolase